MYIRREGHRLRTRVYEGAGEVAELLERCSDFHNGRVLGVSLTGGGTAALTLCTSDGQEYRFLFEGVESFYVDYDSRFSTLFAAVLRWESGGTEFECEDAGIVLRSRAIRAERRLREYEPDEEGEEYNG